MAVDRISPNGENEPPTGDGNFPGDMSDPADQALMKDGVDKIEEGELDIEDAAQITKTMEILKRRGLNVLASRVSRVGQELNHIGHEMIHFGNEEIEQADRHALAHKVADLVQSEPQQLTVWQGEIQAITQVIQHSVSVRAFVAGAEGDAEKGRQRRDEALHLGDWLTRVEAGAIRTAEDAIRVGLAIVSFIADVETIRDHVPEPVWRAIWAALESLFEFLPFLRFA